MKTVTFQIKQRVKTIIKSIYEPVFETKSERLANLEFKKLSEEHPKEYFELIKLETRVDCLDYSQRVRYPGDKVESAFLREERHLTDHPVVKKFWETFHHIESITPENETLNHSGVKGEIAVNINEFFDKAKEVGCELDFKSSALKKALENGCKTYRLVARNKTTYSYIKGGAIRCWIFIDG